MSNWVKIGSRYLNLANVTEVRMQDQHRQAFVYFVGGGALQLDEDDAETLEAFLADQATIAEMPHRTISAPEHQG